MKSTKFVSLLVLLALLTMGIQPTFAHVIGPNSPISHIPLADEPIVDEPVISTVETQEWVQGPGELGGRYVTVTKVLLSQTATVRVPQPGLPAIQTNVQPDWVVYSGDYVMTMERWLRNSPDWLGRSWVDAGGSTATNVTAQEIRVSGTHWYGGSGCNSQGPNFSGTNYNTTSVSAQTAQNLFGGNQYHCVKSGTHQAKINGSWPFWVTGQEGPTAYW